MDSQSQTVEVSHDLLIWFLRKKEDIALAFFGSTQQHSPQTANYWKSLGPNSRELDPNLCSITWLLLLWMSPLSSHHMENPPKLHSASQLDQGQQPAWPWTQHKRETELLVVTTEKVKRFLWPFHLPTKEASAFRFSCRSNTRSLVLEAYCWNGYMIVGLIHKRHGEAHTSYHYLRKKVAFVSDTESPKDIIRFSKIKRGDGCREFWGVLMFS